MRKVRITALPKAQSGLEVKMKSGLGFNSNVMPWPIMAGEFSEPEIEVNKTLLPVAREGANLEAELGEYAFTDKTGDGIPQLYRIGGKRHYDGGTPLNLPDDSFIYSRDNSMKIGGDILNSFGKNKGNKKKFTPAELASQYQINDFRKVLADKDTDKTQRETAEKMIANFNLKLAKLGLVQESTKGFPDGIPRVSMPYMEMMGIDPSQFFGQQGQEEQGEPRGQQEYQEGQEEQPLGNNTARYGGIRKFLPKHQVTGVVGPAGNTAAPAQTNKFELSGQAKIDYENPNITVLDFDNKYGEGATAKIWEKLNPGKKFFADDEKEEYHIKFNEKKKSLVKKPPLNKYSTEEEYKAHVADKWSPEKEKAVTDWNMANPKPITPGWYGNQQAESEFAGNYNQIYDRYVNALNNGNAEDMEAAAVEIENAKSQTGNYPGFMSLFYGTDADQFEDISQNLKDAAKKERSKKALIPYKELEKAAPEYIKNVYQNLIKDLNSAKTPSEKITRSTAIKNFEYKYFPENRTFPLMPGTMPYGTKELNELNELYNKYNSQNASKTATGTTTTAKAKVTATKNAAEEAAKAAMAKEPASAGGFGPPAAESIKPKEELENLGNNISQKYIDQMIQEGYHFIANGKTY